MRNLRLPPPEDDRRSWELFDEGCELLESGKMRTARETFKLVLLLSPNHIDARAHLAIIHARERDFAGARGLLEEAIAIARKSLPVRGSAVRLEWLELNNRPYLRCVHHLGLLQEREGDLAGALASYQELLARNPNDNQGARALAVGVLLALNRNAEVLRICNRYRDDMMVDLTYGKALALFRLGRHAVATEALKKALRASRLVAQELLKTRHRRPRSMRDGYITLGGADEAWEYWSRSGRFWAETPGALEWLHQVIQSTRPVRRRGKVRSIVEPSPEEGQT